MQIIGVIIRILTGRGGRKNKGDDAAVAVALSNDDPLPLPVERGGRDITSEVEKEAEKLAKQYDTKHPKNAPIDGGAYQALPGKRLLNISRKKRKRMHAVERKSAKLFWRAR